MKRTLISKKGSKSTWYDQSKTKRSKIGEDEESSLKIVNSFWESQQSHFVNNLENQGQMVANIFDHDHDNFQKSLTDKRNDIREETYQFISNERLTKGLNISETVRKNENMITVLQHRSKTIGSIQSVISVFITTSNLKIPVRIYNLIRAIVFVFSEEKKFKTYRSVHDNLWKYLLLNCLPKSYLFDLQDQQIVTKSINHEKTIRIISPSSWAIYDVMDPFCFNQLTSRASKCEGPEIDDMNIYNLRKNLTTLEKTLPVMNGDKIYFASTGDEICLPLQVSENSVLQRFQPFITRRGQHLSNGKNNDCVFRGKVQCAWMVVPENIEMNSKYNIEMEQHHENLSNDEKDFLQFIHKGNTYYQLGGLEINNGRYKKIICRPGDTCVLFKSFSSPTRTIAVYISHFKRSGRDDTDREEIVLFKRNGTHSFSVIQSINVTGIGFLLTEKESSQLRNSKEMMAPRSGVLANGMKYVRYPFLFYQDSFEKSNSAYTKDSLGGCYLKPLGLSPRSQSLSSSARVISLTANGQNSNKVLDIIIDDIFDGTINGVKGKDPSGEDIMIFLDPIGFLTDYKETSSMLDTLSHMADHPCSACTFQRRKHNIGSEYGYSSTINGMRSPYLRTAQRSLAVRIDGLSEMEAQAIGMRFGEISTIDSIPLFRLYRKFRENNIPIPVDLQGRKIITTDFDPYQAVMVAPDHCLMGLGRNLIQLFFMSLPNATTRKKMDILICTSLVENGLPKESSIFNCSSDKLHSLSMSSVFCIMLILQSLADLFLQPTDVNKTLVRLIRKLHQIISRLYWWPTNKIAPIIPREGHHKIELLPLIQDDVRDFVNDVDQLRNMDREKGKLVDKPNLHRLVELVNHSLTSYGSARLISEMPLESVHQVLKRSMRDNTHLNKHLTAVYHAICSTWQQRVIQHLDAIQLLTDEETIVMKKSLCCLLLGRESSNLEESKQDHVSFMDELYKKISVISMDPLRKYIISGSKLNFSIDTGQKLWVTAGTGESKMPLHMDEGRRLLVDASFNISPSDITEHSTASLTRVDKNGRKNRCYPFNTIRCGSAVQIRATESNISQRIVHHEFHEGNSIEQNTGFFAVCGIISSRKSKEVWIVALPFQCKDGEKKVFKVQDNSVERVSIIALDSSTRRVCAVHRCTRKCEVCFSSQSVHHDGSIFNQRFTLLGDKDGYPPRMS